MAKEEYELSDIEKEEYRARGPWSHIIRGMWRSPLGLAGVILTTICATLMFLGFIVEIFGLTDNIYVPLIAFLVLPGGMITGLIIIPIAAYLRRRQWAKYGIARDHLHINLSDHKHRRLMIYFVVLTVLFFTLLTVIGYEAYHFSDSPFFCGKVCHQVMEPEHVAYERSNHAKVVCIECHIGSGAQWFVRAKISGLRQVLAIVTNSYNRPIPAPVEHLRPARDTCESCHWPDKFTGKKIKSFYHFTNDDQKNVETNDIALHIGGRNPVTDNFEGIHWHVSKDVKVEYLSSPDRKQMYKVHVTRPDGTEDEFINPELDIKEIDSENQEWRTMDCIDCHNRPTHVYQLPVERVDYGLVSKRINSDIEGIREDALTVITKEYNTRDEAKESMFMQLEELQAKRHGPDFVIKHKEDLQKAADYLLESYLGNVWPEMNLQWGTYGSHLGHQREDEGYGCFRCHDDSHENSEGTTISQDCSTCHDEPE